LLTRGLLTHYLTILLKTQPPKPKSKSILAKLPPAVARIVTAAVLLPVLIVSIIFPALSLLFVLLTVAALVVALFEFWLLARKQQIRADAAAGLLGAAALCTVFYFTEPG